MSYVVIATVNRYDLLVTTYFEIRGGKIGFDEVKFSLKRL